MRNKAKASINKASTRATPVLTRLEDIKDISSGPNQRSQSNSEAYDIESSTILPFEERNDTVEREGEKLRSREGLNPRGHQSSFGGDPRRGPGAHRISGVSASLSFESTEFSLQEGTHNVSERPDTASIPQLSAQLVDEAAEEQRRQEYERERQHNRELESQIRRMHSEAVVAIPVLIEDSNGPITSTNSRDRAASGCFPSRKVKRCFVACLIVLVVAAIGCAVLVVMVGKQSDTTTPVSNVTSISNVSTWNQLGQSLNGGADGDQFGSTVALSGNGMVVAGGALRNNFNGDHMGHVRVFSYDSGVNSWKQLGQVLNGNKIEDELGTSVALSWNGSVIATGARTDLNRKGYVQVHKYDNMTNQWTKIGQLEGRASGDWFGYAAVLSADGAIVAAGGPGRYYNEFDYNGNKTGYARVLVYENTTSSWTPMGQELNGTVIGEAFGRSLALSADGKILAVGADFNNNTGFYAGLVQAFAFDSGNDRWEQMGQDLVGNSALDRFGFAVSLSKDGTILAVGAVGNGIESGRVRVFSYDSVTRRWNQAGQDIDGEFDTDRFGAKVALSADGMVVAAGAPFNDGTGGRTSGHVRVFSFDNRTQVWNQVGRDLDGKEEDDVFGVHVDLSWDGTIVAAGAALNDGNGLDSGHVRVFKRAEPMSARPEAQSFPPSAPPSALPSAEPSVLPPASPIASAMTTVSPTYDNSTWKQFGQTLSGEAAGDRFGFSIALSGNGKFLAGGGPGIDDNGLLAGHVRAFSYESGMQKWNQVGQDLNGRAERDGFGKSVALSHDGAVLAAGSYNDQEPTSYVRVLTFRSDTGTWIQMGQDLEWVASGVSFGKTVALSADGSIVAAGGPGSLFPDVSDYDAINAGYVQVFAFNSTASLWTQMGQVLNGASIGEAFGTSVALSSSGTVVAVGADRNNDIDPLAGSVKVFTYNGGKWLKKGQTLYGERADDRFGRAVALSEDGTVLAVGAVWNDGVNGKRSGHVRVLSFDPTSNLWLKTGLDIDGESEDSNFGNSVALSADGTIVAAGANRNDGDGKEHSGQVRVFSYDGFTNRWIQVGEDLDGMGTGDEFGASVALSSDGTIVAGGAVFNDGNGPDSGNIRVFEARENSN